MTLYTYNKSPDAGAERLKACLRMLASGDSLLLLEDGVYAALHMGKGTELRNMLPSGVALHTLAPDLAARGISAKIPADFSSIDYSGFVRLCLTHQRVVNWN
jgi:tRNA 2-thiouridine synthesizing protein B